MRQRFYGKAKNVDPENTAEGKNGYRIICGGSWINPPKFRRAAVRAGGSTVHRDFGNIGFRVVIAPISGVD